MSVDFWPMKTDLAIRIEVQLEALGMSARAASLQAGLHADTVGKVLSGASKTLRMDNLAALAKVLNVSPTWLASGQEDDAPPPEENEYAGLPYGGILEAGTWRQADLMDQTGDGRRILTERDPRFPRGQFVAYEIRGDSMNEAGIVEGMWAKAMELHDWNEWYGGLRTGLIVVACAERNNGQEIELTIKELRVFKDHYELWPRSTNPAHKPIEVRLNRDPDATESVRIKGIVTKVEKIVLPY